MVLGNVKAWSRSITFGEFGGVFCVCLLALFVCLFWGVFWRGVGGCLYLG